MHSSLISGKNIQKCDSYKKFPDIMLISTGLKTIINKLDVSTSTEMLIAARQ